MMNGGWWGSSWMDGYSWYVMAIVMIAVVVLVVWAVGQDKK